MHVCVYILIHLLQGFFHCTLVERRQFHTAIMVYRILHRLSPTYLQDTFKYTTTVTSHVGRNRYRLFVPRVRTTYGKNSLFCIGTQVWNSYTHPFTLQPLLDDLNICISLIFKYI